MKVDVQKIESESGKKFVDLDELKHYLKGTEAPQTQDLSVLGSGYQFEDIVIPPLTIGIFPILEAIESPFVDFTGEKDITRLDFVKAIYVIFKGREAITPIMGLIQRQNSLLKLEKTAKQSPELYKVYLDKYDEISKGYTSFENNAIEFCESLEITDWADLEEQLIQMFTDLYDSLASTITEEDGKKKALG